MTVARTAGFALLYVVVTYGLAICKRIVERHGGSIFAMDNPQGYGTSLVFTLPAAHQYAPYGTDTPAYASA